MPIVTCSVGGSATCNTVNNSPLLDIDGSECADEGNGNICTFTEDDSCTTSSDCAAKSFGNLLPRCYNPNGGTDAGTCMAAS